MRGYNLLADEIVSDCFVTNDEEPIVIISEVEIDCAGLGSGL